MNLRLRTDEPTTTPDTLLFPLPAAPAHRLRLVGTDAEHEAERALDLAQLSLDRAFRAFAGVDDDGPRAA